MKIRVTQNMLESIRKTNEPKLFVPAQALREDRLPFNLIEASSLINVADTREEWNLSGEGLAVAVLDTGLKTDHKDFEGRVVIPDNFAPVANSIEDKNGHGTHVAGIIAARSDRYIGVAPNVKIVPLKVLDNRNEGKIKDVARALNWVADNHQKYKITAVNLSLDDFGNYEDDEESNIVSGSPIGPAIRRLANDHNIPVVAASGNNFTKAQGMSSPAIYRETISVGAVFDSTLTQSALDEIQHSFGGANRWKPEARRAVQDAIAPFSQRLHESTSPRCRTSIFAPGSPIEASGISDERSSSLYAGTSQAAPFVTGVIILMQEFYRRRYPGKLPSVNQLENWLRKGGVPIIDGDDEVDNVSNTNLEFLRLDAWKTIKYINSNM